MDVRGLVQRSSPGALDVPGLSATSLRAASQWHATSSSFSVSRQAVSSRAAPVKKLLRSRDCLGTSRPAPAGICRASYDPFPFDESDYERVALQVIAGTHTAPDGAPVFTGSLMLTLEGETVKPLRPDMKALILTVSGDTVGGIASVLQGKMSERPMALDLLWSILERGQDISKRDWRLLRVAIVELRDMVYIGRLFFGDADTGVVVWDCDCRPSDASWLALKAQYPIVNQRSVWVGYATLLRDLVLAQCPIFVKRSVWEGYATPLRDIVLAGRGGEGGAGAKAAAAAAALSGTALLTTIQGDEAEPIKRLKREMAVALAEEDYSVAARIRDHPFMQLHLRILEHRREGRPAQARELEAELDRIIQEQAPAEHAGD